MLKSERHNTHHSKLPNPSAIGQIVGLGTIDPSRRCIGSHYPLCDNIWPYSHGIHTVFVRFLDNGEIARFSAICSNPLNNDETTRSLAALHQRGLYIGNSRGQSEYLRCSFLFAQTHHCKVAAADYFGEKA